MADIRRHTSERCLKCSKLFAKGTGTCPDDQSDLVPHFGQNLIGTTFADRYEILSILGEGGMSIVYKARHLYMERTVAVKLLHEHIVSDDTARLRFQREAQAVGGLSHHNIIAVYDFGLTKDDQAFIVMDCLEGLSLADILEKERRLGVERAVDVFKQTCDGLEHAHKKGIIHRDLKPSNLVLVEQEDGSDQVKIVDFGIAKVTPQAGKQKQQLTQTGEVFGSPLYMSPEQCNGRELDARSDIYSFGCLMYEALTGEPPFVGENFVTTVVKHINEPTPPMNSIDSNLRIPEPLEYVVRKCLEKIPENRYQSAAELRQSLMDAALASGIEGFRPGAVMDPVTKKELQRTWQKLIGTIPGINDNKAPAHSKFFYLCAAGLPLMLLVGGAAFIYYWPGPENDKGTIFTKAMFLVHSAWAEDAAKAQSFDKARDEVKKAKEIAATIGDSKSRYLRALILESDILGEANAFEEQEKTNQEIVQIQQELALAEMKLAKDFVEQLYKTGESNVARSKAQLEAESNAGLILMVSKKLFGRSLFSQCEDLLKDSIHAFEQVGVRDSSNMAEMKLMLADCLLRQQKFEEIRPLLVSALNIRKSQPEQDNPAVLKVTVAAMLRLGQFDRDQSNFGPAEKELSEAKALVESKLADDKVLLMESLNSYADLLRQTGKLEESKKLFASAKAIENSIPAPHKHKR